MKSLSLCRFLIFSFLAASFGIASGAPAFAQGMNDSNKKVIRGLRSSDPIEVDGVLSEPAWSKADAISDLVQQEPAINEPITEHTEIHVIVGDDAIYFGVVCADSNAKGVIGRELRRDNSLASDDRFEILIDTFHDHRNAFHFVINPLGTQYDALITDEGQDVNVEWDERWWSEATITDKGWTAEIKIPFITLRSRPNIDTWGLNFKRFIRRKSEIAQWTGWDRDYVFLNVSQAGHLEGVGGIETGLKLRIKPYALGGFTSTSIFGDSNTDAVHEIGLEVMKFSLSPSLTGEVTLNTDFAQTEVDDAIINLTRFPAFYPEKREFFLERAGIFEFGLGGRRGGDTDRYLQMYFSRRVGLTDDRREVPIIGGGKLIGRAGGFDLGLINMQTNDFERTPSNNYTVFRTKRNILSRSNVGAFLSNRQSSGSDYNRVFGGDANFTIFKATDIQGFVAKSFTPGRSGDDMAGRLKYNYYTDIYEVFLEHLYVGEDFQHDVGFVRRRDIRRSDAAFIWEPRPKALNTRNLVFRNEVIYITDTKNTLLTREQTFRFTDRLQTDDAFRFTANNTLDRVARPFEIVPGVIVPAAEYNYTDLWVEAELSPRRVAAGRMRYGRGDFYDGSRQYWQFAPNFRPSPRLSLEATYEFNDIVLPQAAFTTHVVNARVNFNINNHLLTSTILQHDTTADRNVVYFRLNYIYRPGDDIFVVYNQAHTDGTDQTDRTLLVKMTYSLDF